MAVYSGTEFLEVVADRQEARGFTVSTAGLEPIGTRVLA